MHTQVMEEICTAGTLEGNGGSMAGSNTCAYPAHANTQEYCRATHAMYVLHTDSENCVHTAVHTCIHR